MSEAEYRDLIRRYIAEVWEGANALDEAALRRFLSPSLRRHMSPLLPPLDLDGNMERLAGIRSAFPNISITLEDAIYEGDRVVLRGTLRGTHLGEFAGLSPTGKDVTVGVIDVIRVEDGQFAEFWGGPDVFDLVRQLGATVTDGD